jgi:sialate O-acetylesterase
MHCPQKFLGLLVAGSLAAPVVSRADVTLPPVFSDHMVLQRELAAPVWGKAEAGEEVTVSIAGQTKKTKADAAGKWSVKLDPLKLGDPLTLTVEGKNKLAISDVLVGDVWLGSGQSNMAGGVRGFAVKDEPLAKLAEATYPRLRVLSSGAKGWAEATPQGVQGFSALMFSFGVPLQKALDVPVGLMVGAVGGTPSGFWISEEAYRSDAACAEAVKKFAATYNPEAGQKLYEKQLAAWQTAEAAAKTEGKPAPRKPVAPAPPGESSRGKIGILYEAHIRPFIPYGIRGVLWDQGEAGTDVAGVDQYTMMGALIRSWRKDWGQGDFPFLYVQKISGGGCALDPENPLTKEASKFSPLPAQVPADGQHRELHVKIARHPKTAMVQASDLGGMTHPILKSSYGARAAQVALGFAYGKKVEFSGPAYAAHKIEGDKVRVSFSHVGAGLTRGQGEKLQGFALAGEDRKFVWADATIDGDAVVLSSAQVPKPVAVRYAWSMQIPWANLFNKDGLPAVTFRTDTW